MNIQQQKELLKLYKQYQTTNKDIIKANLKSLMDKEDLKPSIISEWTGIPVQTIYQLRKHNNAYKPDFITTIVLCDLLKVSITEVIKPIQGLSIPESNTKWDMKAKQEFVYDYNIMELEELCKKYNITQRTATEYNKNFVREF